MDCELDVLRRMTVGQPELSKLDSWHNMKISLTERTNVHPLQYLQLPIGSMYGIYANIGGILMVNVTIYSIHGSYGLSIFRAKLGVFPRCL